MLLEESGICMASAPPEEKLAVVPAVPVRSYFVTNLFSSRKKSNGAAMRTGPTADSNSRSPTPSSMEGKHSRFAMLGRIFKPWKWKRKKKSDKFEKASRNLERQISMRSTKDELIKKGVLLPDGFDQDGKNDSLHQNHIPQLNGFVTDSSLAETDNSRNVQSVTSSSSDSDTYNTIVVTSGQTPLTATSQSNAVPVIHNVSLLNLPDVEEVPSNDGEILLSVLPEPPISVNDIGPIPPPPMFSNPSPLLVSKFHSQPDQTDDQSNPEEEKAPEIDSTSPCVVYVFSDRDPMVNNSTVEEIPAKEPLMDAMPKKSALKKKGPLTCAEFQKLSIVHNRSKAIDHSHNENRPVPAVSIKSNEDSDSDSESESPILWRDYYGDDEECRKVAKVARKDSLALKLAQRPDIKELIDKNIYIAQSEQQSQESKEDVKKILTRRLSLRPTLEELEQRNIFKQHKSPEELQKEKEDKEKTKNTLIRKLSFRPTIEELKERKIIRFNDYVEVTQAQDYDRRADKPWTRLTPRDKAAIRKELNEFKSTEMEVHEESRHFTRFHRP